MTPRLLFRCAGVAVLATASGLGGLLAASTPAAAATRPPGSVSVSFTAAAMAPVMQVTEDEPTAAFHPEAEGDYGYTFVSADPSSASALATVLWPGAAAGNAGTLVAVLGGPSNLSALNDPVQASAETGTDQTHSSITAPTGSAMTASVQPTGPGDEHTTATSALAGGGLGSVGTVGASTSTSTIDFNSGTAKLSATAESSASHIDVAGVVQIASVTSSASAVSTGGQAPELTGATSFQGMNVAGEAAYVDGSGVHLGTPGAPAGPAAVASVDAALASAGMEVYFTAPHTITVGGTSYYYAASVLFYWAPPGDPSHNSFTLSVGGSAVSVTDSAQADLSYLYSTGGSVPGGSSAGASLPAPAGTAQPAPGGTVSPSPSLAGVAGAAASGAPAGVPAPGGGGAILSLPASPAAAASRTADAGGALAVPAAARLPGGIGVGWWVLAGLAALVGAGLTTRVPALLGRRAAAACPRARQARSTFGTGRKAR